MSLRNFHVWWPIHLRIFYQQNQQRHWLPQIKGTVWKPELCWDDNGTQLTSQISFRKLPKFHPWILGGLNPWANSSKLYKFGAWHNCLHVPICSPTFEVPNARQQSHESWSIHCRMTSRARGHLWRNDIDPLQCRMVRMTIKELRHITCILKHQHKCTPEIPWKLLT